MKILHVLSQFEVTGAETAAAALADEQLRRGHIVTIVSDTFSTKVNAHVLNLPIGKRDLRQRLENIRMLRGLLYRNSISVVHAHSRAASWVSFFATRGTGVPLVSSIHGRQHVHLSTKLFSIYGERILPVCGSVQEQLVAQLHYDPSRIIVVPNGIYCGEFQPQDRGSCLRELLGIPCSTKVVAFIGRPSGLKLNVVRLLLDQVVPSVLERHSDAAFVFVGGKTISSSIVERANAINSSFHRQAVLLLGYQPDVRTFFELAEVVVGSGRAALEAMALGRAVVALGESNYGGIIHPGTAEENIFTNFGDCAPRTSVDGRQAVDDITELFRNSDWKHEIEEWGTKFVHEQYDIRSVADTLEQIYIRAMVEKRKLNKREIPVLVYHKVVESPLKSSGHGTWVTRSNFEKQMKFLHQRGYQTVTFSDYHRIRLGEGELPKRPVMLTFDDGYLDNYENAYPVLRKFGLRATIFIVTNLVGRSNSWDRENGEPVSVLLDENKIAEMSQSGIEFGPHSLTHRSLPGLTDSELEKEVSGSKWTLEKMLGKPVIAFCYPYGRLEERVKGAVRSAGYLFGIASDSGPIFVEDDLFEIRRIQIFPDTSLFGFWKKTSGFYHRYKRALRH